MALILSALSTVTLPSTPPVQMHTQATQGASVTTLSHTQATQGAPVTTLNWGVVEDTVSDLLTRLNTQDNMEGFSQNMTVTEESFIFLQAEPLMASLYIVAVMVAICVGVTGNTLIVGVAMTSRTLQGIGIEFVVNLALADISISMVAQPTCLLGVIFGESFFDDRPVLCDFIACLCLSACFSAFLSLSMLTLNRYMYVCHYDLYGKVFTTTSTYAMCASIWGAAFLFESPNFFGWGGHYYDMKTHQCMWNRTGSKSYTYFLSLFLIMVPLIMMTLGYVRILKFIVDVSRRIKPSDDNADEDVKRKMKSLSKSMQTCRGLCVVLGAYVVCWTPYVVVIMVDYHDNLPMWVHLWVTYLAHLHSSLNCIIYAITQPRFRQGLNDLVECTWSSSMDEDIHLPNVIQVTGRSISEPNIQSSQHMHSA